MRIVLVVVVVVDGAILLNDNLNWYRPWGLMKNKVISTIVVFGL